MYVSQSPRPLSVTVTCPTVPFDAKVSGTEKGCQGNAHNPLRGFITCLPLPQLCSGKDTARVGFKLNMDGGRFQTGQGSSEPLSKVTPLSAPCPRACRSCSFCIKTTSAWRVTPLLGAPPSDRKTTLSLTGRGPHCPSWGQTAGAEQNRSVRNTPSDLSFKSLSLRHSA